MRYFIILMLIIPLLTSCERFESWQEERERKASYEKEREIENAIRESGEVYNGDIFLGCKLGMTQDDFYEKIRIYIADSTLRWDKEGLSYLLQGDYDTFRLFIYPDFIDDSLRKLTLDYNEKRSYTSNTSAAIGISSAFMPKYLTIQGSIRRTSSLGTFQSIYYNKSLRVNVYESLFGARVEFSDVIWDELILDKKQNLKNKKKKTQFDQL